MRAMRIFRAIAFVLGIVVRNLLVVIAGPLLLNASFYCVSSSMRRSRHRSLGRRGRNSIPRAASKYRKFLLRSHRELLA